jgi:hypothetical protein
MTFLPGGVWQRMFVSPWRGVTMDDNIITSVEKILYKFKGFF